MVRLSVWRALFCGQASIFVLARAGHFSVSFFASSPTLAKMTDEVEKHVMKKYDIITKLGKGVRVFSGSASGAGSTRAASRAPCFVPPSFAGLRHCLEGR